MYLRGGDAESHQRILLSYRVPYFLKVLSSLTQREKGSTADSLGQFLTGERSGMVVLNHSYTLESSETLKNSDLGPHTQRL